MRSYSLLPAFLLALCITACKEENVRPPIQEESKFLEIVSIQPANGSVWVERGTPVLVQFNYGVSSEELDKISSRYVDDTVATGACIDLVCRNLSIAKYQALLWKAERTVEVVIPRGLLDTSGRMLKDSVVLRFTVEPNPAPLRVLWTSIQHSDTVSLRGESHIFCNFSLNDYIPVLQELYFSVSSPAQVSDGCYFINCRPPMKKGMCLLVYNLEPYRTYTLTLFRSMHDYDGDTLEQDFHLVFHTKP
ncbi:MAG: hypothetical protein KF749_05730 [Bacteroidetes bacterium]|nr:hypothetical protein [Bacteroidota bacterium]MCW5894716.1 hypothetical protein [Bacteroidota bacterium]